MHNYVLFMNGPLRAYGVRTAQWCR